VLIESSTGKEALLWRGGVVRDEQQEKYWLTRDEDWKTGETVPSSPGASCLTFLSRASIRETVSR
jgi:hypothetical protein